MGQIKRTIFYAYPRDMVWAAICDSDALADWLMPNDFQPVVGHQFTFRTDPAPGFDGIVHCQVLDLWVGEGWRISWRGGSLDTVLEIRLTDDDDGAGTKLMLLHTGFGVRDVIPWVILGLGWKRILRKKLHQFLAGLGE